MRQQKQQRQIKRNNQMNSKQKTLIADNHKLVQKFVHRYFPKSSFDAKQDLIAEGYKILCERIDSFDHEKGKYSTWVYAVLGFCLRNVYNKQRFVDSRVNVCVNKYPKMKGPDSMNNEEFAEMLTTNHDEASTDSLDDYVDREILRDHMKKLDEKERKVLEMTYSGYSTDDIVNELQLDYPNQLFYIKKKALNKLKRYFK